MNRSRTRARRPGTAPPHNTDSQPLPEFVAPQLATLVSAVPDGEKWLHELKFDGYRILCRLDNGRVRLLTRNAQDWTARMRAVAEAAKELPARRALIDGEVVAVDESGMHSFQLLQNSFKYGDTSPLVYYAFDLLYLDGRDLRTDPLLERKTQLQRLLSRREPAGVGPLRFSEHWLGQGKELFDQACEMGLEGVIAKRIDEPYRSGRGHSWLKIKCLKSQEFIIGGFTDPAGARLGFGALLLGVHDGGALRYAGRVGTGFNDELLRDLHARLEKLERRSSPFINPPKGADARGVHWVEPVLVGEIDFTAWTSDGLLRHPSFKGLREDKHAAEVTRERPATLPRRLESGSRHRAPRPRVQRLPRDTREESAAPAAQRHDDDAVIAGVKLTHADRVLYPEQGITKRDLAHYYEQNCEWILPHLKGRPLTLVRCPEGHRKQCFYQRHTRESLRPPVGSVTVRSQGKTERYVAVDSLPGLVTLVQMGVLEIHTWGSRLPEIERPDRLTFDLDPGPDVSWDQIKAGAEHLRARLQDLDLGAFVKTTGGKGLHVVVPIAPKQTWDFVRSFSRALAESAAREAPERYTVTMSKAKRQGKIFIDYLRNARAATAVAAYSTRARAGAPVSVPLGWHELESDLRAQFNVRNAPERLARLGAGPWQDYESARRPLTAKLLRRLQ